MTQLPTLKNLLTLPALHALRLTALCLALPAFAAASDAPRSIVGEVTAVIGVGKVLDAQSERTVARGEVIRAGDKIETTAGGHVHIRFIDGGLVSVRPLSRLHIEDYRNQDTHNLAAIKFKLDVGVMRSVTGQWGEAHRDRFRLNTPVAAIGIKGTDFVVKVDGGNTFVTVKTGAIVMSPLEGSCALALGPCAGERSALLSAEMQGQMLEYFKQNGKNMPRLVPYIDLMARSNAPISTPSVSALPATATRQLDANPAVDVTNQELSHQAKEAVLRPLVEAKAVPPKDTSAASSVTVPATVLPTVPVAVTAPPLVVAALPSPPPTIAPPASVAPASPPLVWLHNTQGWNVPGNTISTRFDQASAAGRSAVVGNFFINLYRDETLVKDFTPPATTASFNLTNISANFTQPELGRPAEPVSASGAKMSVDFARSVLSTQIDLTSPALGTERFAATANITQSGIFISNTTGQQLAGAFNNDTKQAGYVFEKRLSTGTVSGLTLWGR